MSAALLKYTARKNWVMLLIFFGVLTMYLTIMISMYDPEDMESITSMLELFPEDLMQAMGFSQLVTDLTSYLASWLYGLLMFAFPMVYCIILSNRLVAKKVDNGSFACFLATPVSRVRVIMTLGTYALLSVIVLFAGLFGVGVAFSEIMHPGLLEIDRFLMLNITVMLVNMAVVMIGFFFSCMFNDSSLATGFGAGIPIGFLLMNMLGGVSDDLEIIKKLSLYGWFDPVELVRDSGFPLIGLVYAGIALVLLASAVIIFRRRRLPL
jgi:ABC-2 type transport system permease protein